MGSSAVSDRDDRSGVPSPLYSTCTSLRLDVRIEKKVKIVLTNPTSYIYQYILGTNNALISVRMPSITNSISIESS